MSATRTSQDSFDVDAEVERRISLQVAMLQRFCEAQEEGGGQIPFSAAVDLCHDYLTNKTIFLTDCEADGQEIVRAVMGLGRYLPHGQSIDGTLIRRLIRDAETDAVAVSVLKLIDRFPATSEAVALVRDWRFKADFGLKPAPKRSRGPRKSTNWARDTHIVSMIKILQRHGRDPTRNDASSHKNSGCDVVREAMRRVGHATSYKTIETVWTDRHRLDPAPVNVEDLFDAAAKAAAIGWVCPE